MELAEFHNGLRVLQSINRPEMEESGVLDQDTEEVANLNWKYFREDPFNWFIQASDEKAELLWGIMRNRGV